MIGCLRTCVRKQPIIAICLSLRMNSSFITSRPGINEELNSDPSGKISLFYMDTWSWLIFMISYVFA